MVPCVLLCLDKKGPSPAKADLVPLERHSFALVRVRSCDICWVGHQKSCNWCWRPLWSRALCTVKWSMMDRFWFYYNHVRCHRFLDSTTKTTNHLYSKRFFWTKTGAQKPPPGPSTWEALLPEPTRLSGAGVFWGDPVRFKKVFIRKHVKPARTGSAQETEKV